MEEGGERTKRHRDEAVQCWNTRWLARMGPAMKMCWPPDFSQRRRMGGTGGQDSALVVAVALPVEQASRSEHEAQVLQNKAGGGRGLGGVGVYPGFSSLG